MPFVQYGEITFFELNDPDFTTVQRIALAVNTELQEVAHALDARAIAVNVNDLPVDPTDSPGYLVDDTVMPGSIYGI